MIKLVAWSAVAAVMVFVFVRTSIFLLDLPLHTTNLYRFVEGKADNLGNKLYNNSRDVFNAFPAYLTRLHHAVPARRTAHNAFRGRTSGVAGASCGAQVAQGGLICSFQPLAIDATSQGTNVQPHQRELQLQEQIGSDPLHGSTSGIPA